MKIHQTPGDATVLLEYDHGELQIDLLLWSPHDDNPKVMILTHDYYCNLEHYDEGGKYKNEPQIIISREVEGSEGITLYDGFGSFLFIAATEDEIVELQDTLARKYNAEDWL